MAADNTDEAFRAPAGGRGRAMQLAIIAILMVGEGVGVFFIANALHDSPDSALAGDVDAVEAAAATPGAGDLVEVEMAECRPGNSSSGKFITLQISSCEAIEALWVIFSLGVRSMMGIAK